MRQPAAAMTASPHISRLSLIVACGVAMGCAQKPRSECQGIAARARTARLEVTRAESAAFSGAQRVTDKQKEVAQAKDSERTFADDPKAGDFTRARIKAEQALAQAKKNRSAADGELKRRRATAKALERTRKSCAAPDG